MTALATWYVEPVDPDLLPEEIEIDPDLLVDPFEVDTDLVNPDAAAGEQIFSCIIGSNTMPAWIVYDTTSTGPNSGVPTNIRVVHSQSQVVSTSTTAMPYTSRIVLNDGATWVTANSTTPTTTCITSNIIYHSFTTGTWSGNIVAGETNWGEIRDLVRPKVKKSTRSSIKRALKLMTGMGFEDDVRIFLNGDTIEVAHPDSLFKFVISKYDRSLIQRTEYPGYSTPYRLELYTKSDVHIANLCVYMDQTPVLDQVLGVAMFIKSGSEEMILKKANWNSLTQDLELREIIALEYPYLKPKMRLPEPALSVQPGGCFITTQHSSGLVVSASAF